MWIRIIALLVGSTIAFMVTRQRVFELRHRRTDHMEPLLLGGEWCIAGGICILALYLLFKAIYLLFRAVTL